MKGIREGRANLRDSFARVEKGDVWLYNVHINPYSHRGYVDHDPRRKRRLLLHKYEIRKLIGKTVEKGLTLVPTTAVLQERPGEGGPRAGEGKAGARQARNHPPPRGGPRDASGRQGARTTLTPIPFNRAAVTGREVDYVTRAITDGPLHGDGPFTRDCHEWLERLTGSHKALLTTSCTHALEMTALLLDLKPGDEVIVPSFTFVSTVNAIVLRGARPVFVDIRPDTLNLDETLIEAAITPRTRAIVAGALRGRRLRDGRHHGHRRRATASRSSRTTPTGSSAPTRAGRSAPSARSRRTASTRPRTSRAARAGRC